MNWFTWVVSRTPVAGGKVFKCGSGKAPQRGCPASILPQSETMEHEDGIRGHMR
jgi:hypothetical protein